MEGSYPPGTGTRAPLPGLPGVCRAPWGRLSSGALPKLSGLSKLWNPLGRASLLPVEQRIRRMRKQGPRGFPGGTRRTRGAGGNVRKIVHRHLGKVVAGAAIAVAGTAVMVGITLPGSAGADDSGGTGAGQTAQQAGQDRARGRGRAARAARRRREAPGRGRQGQRPRPAHRRRDRAGRADRPRNQQLFRAGENVEGGTRPAAHRRRPRRARSDRTGRPGRAAPRRRDVLRLQGRRARHQDRQPRHRQGRDRRTPSTASSRR